MHEMSIAMDMIEIVRAGMARSDSKKLKSLTIRVGEMTAVEPEALRFCFEAAIGKTPFEGARLHIEEIPLKGRCGRCGEEFSLDKYFAPPCPACAGKAAGIVSGRELEIVSMEVE